MEDLINSMAQEDPAKRPRIEVVIQRFNEIRESLSKGKLRSPIMSRKVPKVFRMIQWTRHSIRTIEYIVSRRPSIPDASIQQVSRLA
jgi:hypothetical protein